MIQYIKFALYAIILMLYTIAFGYCNKYIVKNVLTQYIGKIPAIFVSLTATYIASIKIITSSKQMLELAINFDRIYNDELYPLFFNSRCLLRNGYNNNYQ